MTPEERRNLEKDCRLFCKHLFEVGKTDPEEVREKVLNLLYTNADRFVLDPDHPGNVKDFSHKIVTKNAVSFFSKHYNVGI